VKPRVKTFLVAVSLALLTALALFFIIARVRRFRDDGEAGARVWFYDQGANRLYPASRNLIPPDGNSEARVRALVIGFQGMGNEVSQLKIAYLEKYSPKFKALLERAAAAHAAKTPFAEKIPSQSSAYYLDNTFVKRPGEDSWHTFGTVDARQIMMEWRNWRGPAGQPPVISVPSIQ
jgi:hypothetical protein